jgi:hypothetical protein
MIHSVRLLFCNGLTKEMGRTIPSFRQLLEIERLSWSWFKRGLPTKQDKKAFDQIFENAELYTAYLSNAINPIPLESVMMGSLFHNYKTLLEMDEEKEKGDYADKVKVERGPGLESLFENKPHGKLLFDRTCKKWHGLTDSLHHEDRETLLKMVLKICSYNNESCNQIISESDSRDYITYLFFISIIIQQQKLINKISKDENSDIKSKTSKDATLLDFMNYNNSKTG